MSCLSLYVLLNWHAEGQASVSGNGAQGKAVVASDGVAFDASKTRDNVQVCCPMSHPRP